MSFGASLPEIVAEDRTGLLGKPDHWDSEVATILNGCAFPSDMFSPADGVPLIRIRDILKAETQANYTGDYDPQYLTRPGELLVGMDGDFNAALWAGPEGVLNQRVCKISTEEELYSRRFLFCVLPGYLAAIHSHTSSVTVKHLSSRTLAKIPLPLPCRNEQRRIVAKIEELFSELDAGVAALERAQAKLKRYRASVLKAAVEGKLTEQWRKQHPPEETGEQLLQRIFVERRKRWEEEQLAGFEAKGKKPPKNWQAKYKEPVGPDTSGLPDLPQGWCWASVDQIGSVGSGVTKGGKKKRIGPLRSTPYLRVANVQRGFLDLTEIKEIEVSETEAESYQLLDGDVLFTEGGDRDKLGRGWVWRGEIPGCIHQNHVFRVRLFASDFLPELLSHHGNSFGQEWFQRRGTQTVNLASINQTVLRAFPVPVPPALEQKRIVALANGLLDECSRARESVQRQLEVASALRQAILKRAFEGRLVPQDPTDEPASVLLDRIRAEREAEQPKKRRPTTRKTPPPELDS